MNTPPSVRKQIQDHRGPIFAPTEWMDRRIGLYWWDATAVRNPAPEIPPGHVQITKKGALGLVRVNQINIIATLEGNTLTLHEETKG